jgi:hypothetical protein
MNHTNMAARARRGALLSALVLLASCGGGGTPPTTSTPTAPPASAPAVEVRSSLDLRSLAFEKRGLSVLQSSNYYPGIRSPRGHELYLQTFPEHHIVRVNAFDWAAVASSGCQPGTKAGAGGVAQPDYAPCLAQFERVLQQSRGYLDDLTRRNSTAVLMVDIFRTPTWLSRSRDMRPACGGGVLAHGYRPADDHVWQQLLDIAVRFFSSYDGATGINRQVATRVHYQFWNEPDLACNWQEDTAAFLALYAQTATYLRARHPASRIGGPGTEAWAGRIATGGAPRPQNLVFELADFARARQLPLDFLSWHDFSADYRGQLVDGVAAYRAFLAARGIAEADLPLIVNEWLPQDGPPTGLTRYLATDAANALLAFFETNIAQGGVPWQDYGPAKSDAWGIVAFNESGNEDGLADAAKKPIFHVVEFFDRLSRSSQGLHSSREDILLDAATYGGSAPFKVGERALLVSREAEAGCYRIAAWNRLASPEQGSVAYLLAQGITLDELQRAYGSAPQALLDRAVAAIRAGAAFDPKWTAAFRQAQAVERWLAEMRDRREFAYSIALAGFSQPAVTEARSIGRDGVFIQDKAMAVGADARLAFSLKPEELVHARLCGG